MNTSTLVGDATSVAGQVDGKSCELCYAQFWYIFEMMRNLSCRNYDRLSFRFLLPPDFPPASSRYDRAVDQISKPVNQVSEHDSFQKPHETQSDVRYSHLSPHILHMLKRTKGFR